MSNSVWCRLIQHSLHFQVIVESTGDVKSYNASFNLKNKETKIQIQYGITLYSNIFSFGINPRKASKKFALNIK